MAATTIRIDLFSVKHWDGSSWVHGFITTDQKKAHSRADAIRRGIWHGVHVTRSKVVHPAQWVVNGYCAAGNDIS